MLRFAIDAKYWKKLKIIKMLACAGNAIRYVKKTNTKLMKGEGSLKKYDVYSIVKKRAFNASFSEWKRYHLGTN